MKYRLIGNELQLVKFVVIIPSDVDENGNPAEYTAASETERDMIMSGNPDAEFTEIDNSGYEWLGGMTFTKEQIKNGDVERIIEMGEDAYTEMLNAPTTEDYLIDLDYRMSKIELGI